MHADLLDEHDTRLAVLSLLSSITLSDFHPDQR